MYKIDPDKQARSFPIGALQKQEFAILMFQGNVPQGIIKRFKTVYEQRHSL